MKKSSRKALSRLLAGIMLVSSIFGQATFASAADSNLAAYADGIDVVTSPAAVGKSYSVQFSSLGDLYAEDNHVSGAAFCEGTVLIVSSTGRAYWHDASHGLALANGEAIQVNVAGNADVSIGLCAYGKGQIVVTDAAGNTLTTLEGRGSADGEKVSYSYKGDATVLSFTIDGAGGETYIHGVDVVNDMPPVGEAENFELFLDDIATDVSSVDEATGETVITKTFDQQTIKYKDSTLTLVGNKNDDGSLIKFTPEREAAKNISRGGRDGVNGYKAGQRNANCNDLTTIPVFGDGTAVVFSPAATGTFNAYYDSTSFMRVWDFDAATGERNGYVDSEAATESFAFKAVSGHTYVLSTTGKTNNLTFVGFEYIIDEPTDVTITTKNVDANEASLSSLQISLTDVALGGDPAAVVGAGTNTVNLAKGHTYKLTTNDGGVKAVVDGKETFKAENAEVTVELYDIPDVTLTGEITGTPEGTVTELSFKNNVNGAVSTATITGTQYTATLKPGDYTTSVVTTNGGATYDHVKVVLGEENVNEVYVELPDPGYHELPAEIAAADSVLTFNSADPAAPIRVNNSTSIRASAGDSITVPVSGKQKVTVSGWYSGTWDINGQNSVTTSSSANAASPTTTSYFTDGTETSVTVNITGDGANYLYWIKVEDTIEFKSEINVPQDYATLNDANKAISSMLNRPEGEAGRVTINLNTDLEEQVVFTAPYITLKGNGHEINWYYGVGTCYYSIDKGTGLYNERLFRDKYNAVEGDGSLWGGVVIVRGDNFLAENTVFRNTYNYEMTAKAVEDTAYTLGAIPARTADTDVTKYASKERSNAFYVEAKNIELYNCEILSSQDTFGRNGSADNGYSIYLKDCVIGGNTDYICGEFTAVFDNCELQWKTYKDDATNNGKIGFITAPKTNPYIFRNCTVTCDGVAPAADVLGLYGRTWGANSRAIFINTETNGMINADGWGEMSAGDGKTAKFEELNNTSKGEAFASAKFATVLSEADAAVMTSDEIIAAYLGGWTPVHYSYETRFTGLWGDADKSGILTANDASAVLAYVLDPTLVNNDNYDFAGCDVDDSGDITAADAAMILQKVLDAGFVFPAEPTTEATTAELPIDESPNYIPVEPALAKQIVYNGVDAQVVAVQPMERVEDAGSTGVFGDTTYPGYSRTTSVNTPLTVDGSTSPGYRVAYAITAKNDVTVSIDTKVNKGKAVYLTTEDATVENAVISSIERFENTAADAFTTVSATIKAGQTLYVIGKGTNLPIYAVRFAAATIEEDPVGDPLTLYVVGDSTGCDYIGTDNNYYYKRVGFGTELKNYFKENVTVTNLALSGRSSKSFITENNYATLTSSMKQGDYLLIAFGHNDEKLEDATRGTTPGGTKETEGSFKNSLYVNYIQPALAAGATPILATPIVRRTGTGTWSDSQLHKTNGGDYAQDIIDLGAELGLTVIDTTSLTKAVYDELTPAGTIKLHAWTSSKETSVDNTHLNRYGAKYVAYLIANAVKESALGLSADVKSDIAAPTEADINLNPDYVETPTDDPTDFTSKLWTTTSPYYGSVFGDIGGAGKLQKTVTNADGTTTTYDDQLAINSATNEPYFDISENADGSVHLRAGALKDDNITAATSVGKIAGSTDGVVMYYRPVDVSQNFEISGTITVNGANKNNQVAFGAIVSDMIRVDEYQSEYYTYVAASPLRLARAGAVDKTTGEPTYANGTYARIDGALKYGPETISEDVTPGTTINVSIKKLGNQYTATYGDITETYTVDMVGTVYAGFYVARCADITVTNINFNNEVVE